MRITSMAPGEFGVELEEGDRLTGHRVRVPDGFVDDVAPGTDEETVVRESFAFLLEREPATSILATFSLPDITRYFPEYPQELRRRLS